LTAQAVDLNAFGVWAPGNVCFEKFTLTTKTVVVMAKKSMA